METKKVYPEWVQKHREKGTTVKKVGNNYYLYRHTSRRVAGKKNPVPVDTYIGRITPEGVEKAARRKLASGEVEVREFGFSRAVEQLCPQGWKEPLGRGWQAVLDFIILRESPESYIRDIREVPASLDPHIQLGAQVSMLNRRMATEYGVCLKELKILSSIYLVYIGRRTLVSRMSGDQCRLAEQLGICLEVD